MNHDMKQRIIKKGFSVLGGQDNYVWKFNRNGIYSVRNSYQVLTNDHTVEETRRMPTGVWNRLWSLKLPFKLIVFLWKICNNCVPARTEIHRRV